MVILPTVFSRNKLSIQYQPTVPPTVFFKINSVTQYWPEPDFKKVQIMLENNSVFSIFENKLSIQYFPKINSVFRFPNLLIFANAGKKEEKKKGSGDIQRFHPPLSFTPPCESWIWLRSRHFTPSPRSLVRIGKMTISKGQTRRRRENFGTL